MQVFGRVITKDGDSFPSSHISLIKEMQLRIDDLEKEVYNLKFALNEFTEGKAQLLCDTSLSRDNIDTKLNHPLHKSIPSEDHLKQARDFINTMIDNDKKDILKKIDMRTEGLLQFVSGVETFPGLEASQKFFKELDSENLLELIKLNPLPRKKEHLDNFLLNLGPDIKVRRISKKVTIKTNKFSNKALKGKEFLLSKKKIKDLKGLHNSLKKVRESTCNKNKEKFAKWTKEVLGYKKLARSIALTKSKLELVKLLKKTISSE